MISADRFLARSVDRERWLEARRDSVTATQVADAASGPGGLAKAIERIDNPEEITPNKYMEFGTNHEAVIAYEIKEKFLDEFGLLPSDWLIAAEVHRWETATPDLLSVDHLTIGEIKTTGTDWGSWEKVPVRYKRQVQWQLHVTGAERAVFAYMLRAETPTGELVPAWLEPLSFVVERDETMIANLQEVAGKLREHSVYKSWEE